MREDNSNYHSPFWEHVHLTQKEGNAQQNLHREFGMLQNTAIDISQEAPGCLYESSEIISSKTVTADITSRPATSLVTATDTSIRLVPPSVSRGLEALYDQATRPTAITVHDGQAAVPHVRLEAAPSTSKVEDSHCHVSHPSQSARRSGQTRGLPGADVLSELHKCHPSLENNSHFERLNLSSSSWPVTTIPGTSNLKTNNKNRIRQSLTESSAISICHSDIHLPPSIITSLHDSAPDDVSLEVLSQGLVTTVAVPFDSSQLNLRESGISAIPSARSCPSLSPERPLPGFGVPVVHSSPQLLAANRGEEGTGQNGEKLVIVVTSSDSPPQVQQGRTTQAGGHHFYSRVADATFRSESHTSGSTKSNRHSDASSHSGRSGVLRAQRQRRSTSESHGSRSTNCRDTGDGDDDLRTPSVGERWRKDVGHPRYDSLLASNGHVVTSKRLAKSETKRKRSKSENEAASMHKSADLDSIQKLMDSIAAKKIIHTSSDYSRFFHPDDHRSPWAFTLNPSPSRSRSKSNLKSFFCSKIGCVFFIFFLVSLIGLIIMLVYLDCMTTVMKHGMP